MTKHKLLKKRWFQVLLIVIIVVVFNILLWLPDISERYMEKYVAENYSRNLTIDDIDINYFSATIRIEHLQFREKKGRESFIRFDTLECDLQVWPLIFNELRIKSFSLINPYVQILQNDTLFNFSDLITVNDDSVIRVQDDAATNYKFDISNILIAGGKIKYQDQLLDHIINLNDLTLDIPNIHWEENQAEAGIKFNLGDGEVAFQSAIDLAENDYRLNIGLSQIDLNIITPYLQQLYPVGQLQGTTNGNLIINGSTQDAFDVNISGNLEVKDLYLDDKKGKLLVSSEIASSHIDSIHLGRQAYHFSEMHISEPQFNFTIFTDSTNNWLEVFLPEDQLTNEKTPADTMQQDIFDFTIAGITAENGRLSVEDQSIEPAALLEFTEINFLWPEYNSNSPQMSLQTSCKILPKGNLQVAIAISDIESNYYTMDVSLSGFDMRNFNNWCLNYTGYPISRGKLDFYTKTSSRPNQFKSDNSFFANNLYMDKKAQKGLYNVPLRLGVSLLRNLKGEIDIDLPIESDVQDTTIKYGPVIWKALSNVLIKAAASPYTLLAKAFQVNENSLKTIYFDTLQETFTKETVKTMELLSEILHKKDELVVAFEPNCDSTRLIKEILEHDARSKYALTTDSIAITSDSAYFAFINKTCNDTTSRHASDKWADYLGAEKVNELFENQWKVHKDSLFNKMVFYHQIDSSRVSFLPMKNDTTLLTQQMNIFYDVD